MARAAGAPSTRSQLPDGFPSTGMHRALPGRMRDCHTDEVPVEAREETHDADEDSCAARRAKGLPAIRCTRGAECHCARPIGHPIPIETTSTMPARRHATPH